MRGGGMEDVIFAGTAQRPPRDFAEVVLSAKDDEGEELEVVRRIERGAGSAYRVNGHDVRAKDVSLIFADAATGAHSPALVSQGKIAQVIAAKPAERRQMLEEAAGIAGLHVRRRDAESKLRQTEANLARLEDLMAGMDSQIASLKRQARQAERYRELSEQIALAEARLIFARWRDAAAAADAARADAAAAEKRVADAQAAMAEAQKAQNALAAKLAEAREDVADRRDDATAHGHRMASLGSQLEAAQERLADLDRQKARLEEDRGDADRLTKDSVEALARLEAQLKEGTAAFEQDEARRPALARALEKAEDNAQSAELALARATADHAGVEAEWRLAQGTLAQAQQRVDRLAGEMRRVEDQRAEAADAGDGSADVDAAKSAATAAAAVLEEKRAAVQQARLQREELVASRDALASEASAARAELAGAERELQALRRDAEARARQSKGKGPVAIDAVRAKPGYERALAAALGRDARAMLSDASGEGRFWTGADAPSPVDDSLAHQISDCPPQLAARLALVRVAQDDDGRDLPPGHWLVTREGRLRRWDGFVALGEGAAEAARLEAVNRLAALENQVPPLRDAADKAESAREAAETDAAALGQQIVALERDVAAAADAERSALRAVDQAETQAERLAARTAQLVEAQDALATQIDAARSDLAEAEAARDALPDPATGRAALDEAAARNEAARTALQSASAALASHDQALAVARERLAAQKADIAGWQARAGDAARRLSDMEHRFEEIAQERAVIAAKPEGLMREIEAGDATRTRLAENLHTAEAKLAETEGAARDADAAFHAANEALSSARETRAGLAERAQNQDGRRQEMARISGERFQSPPPLLPEKFGFDPAGIADAGDESEAMDRLVASRERIGPVNLVAADELAELEGKHGSSAQEQAELGAAVNRLRGSIGNLNREGRERLRAAFEEVDTHFRRLFTRLFEGGQAHLALVDSDDPLEAGLEIFAQPPGKRLQSLTLLSGGEQALTAIALIFALFLTNPAPICVLDEVDAPLDDANIDRFCDLLDQMTRETDTRYLIVTHNAVTMSRMHRLFGVTMIEQGISRLVSVDLGGAEELLAAE
jgi:chromosome segregation protein